MRFTKSHGLGNDYILLDATADRSLANSFRPADHTPRLCHRHRGVGADGVILVERAESETDRFRMRIWNADASEAEMCGNGIRCVVKLLVDRRHVSSLDQPISIETSAGLMTATPLLDQDTRCRAAAIDMPPPVINPARLPIRRDLLTRDASAGAEAMLDDLPLVFVATGNPHAVSFQDAEPTESEIRALGPRIEAHPAFPERINLHLASVAARDHVVMRSWERGAGATDACGTGACAVVVAGVLTDRLDPRTRVELPGGSLQIEYNADSEALRMTGPAEEICTGDWSQAHSPPPQSVPTQLRPTSQ